jgi:hypothetical protein
LNVRHEGKNLRKGAGMVPFSADPAAIIRTDDRQKAPNMGYIDHSCMCVAELFLTGWRRICLSFFLLNRLVEFIAYEKGEMSEMKKCYTASLTVAVCALVLAGEVLGADSQGLQAAWEFEAIQRGVMAAENVSPGNIAWGGFSRIPNPSGRDYADASQGNGVTFATLAPLAPLSGAVSVLNDGKGQENDNSPSTSLFFAADSELNRILIDLNGLQPVYQVNTYSWHKYGRKNQKHELFYNASASPSDPKAVPLGSDWVSLGSAATAASKSAEAQVGISFAEADGGVIAKARHLLLAVNFSPCFYGEIDVVTDVDAVQKLQLPSDAQVQAKKLGPDLIHGNVKLVDGVRGKAAKFDGFSTRVVRQAGQTEPLGKSFTIEAWVAPQEYSQNQTAIIDRSVERDRGYFLGVDAKGHLIFQANIGGKWQLCTSSEPLPILCWSHVAATFDPANGVALYIDGKPAGSLSAKGQLVSAPEADIWIGMSHLKQPPDVHTRTGDPTYMVFDGLIDEVRIHNRALSSGQAQAAFAAVQPAVAQPLQYRQLPSGPKDGKRFGAAYTRLKYAPEWDASWRVGDFSDVVITFEDPRANFVFWRGTSYIPHWVSDNGIWYNNQFIERPANGDGCVGCVEPMSDKRCRYSRVKIVQSNPARTIVHWRYAPVGVNYKHIFMDPYTSQGDWVDEYYTVYSDMVGVRSLTLHSSEIDASADLQESIIVHQPGRTPEENIEATAITIGNLAGEVVDYTWPGIAEKGGSMPGLPDLSCIQIVNLKSEVKPFIVIPPSPDVPINKFRGHSPASIFRWWNHWPVSQGRTTATGAVEGSRPSHTSLTIWKHWETLRSTENSKTYVMLHGMTDKKVNELTGLAKSWLSAPEANVLSGTYRSAGFDKEQKAYVVESLNVEKAGTLRLKFDATPDSPLVNPAIVVKNWPADAAAKIKVSGHKLRDEDTRIGLEQGLEACDLVVWIRLEAAQMTEIEINPGKK